MILEVCVDDAAGIAAAVSGGANRIELCSALALGGLSPSAGLIALAAEAPIPAMAMIRPRAGDFIWSAEERRAMRAEIRAVKAAGLAGVVIGASRPDGRLDGECLAELMAEAEGLYITLHRAIDLTPDPLAALALCRDLGIGRVLTSGGATSVAEGLERLALMAKAAPDITILPGGGVSEALLPALLAAIPQLSEVHASCSAPLPAPALPQIEDFGFQPKSAKGTDAARVRALRSALDRLRG